MITLCERRTAWDNLTSYCISAKKKHYIEMTEWTNLEGVDIKIVGSLGERNISVTYGELEAIIALHKKMYKDELGEK